MWASIPLTFLRALDPVPSMLGVITMEIKYSSRFYYCSKQTLFGHTKGEGECELNEP